MVLKMSYPLSHTVVNKKKKKKGKEKKNNRNKLSRSVANGKQYKHQHTLLSYGSMIRYNNLILIRRNLITILNSKIAHFPFITNSRILS